MHTTIALGGFKPRVQGATLQSSKSPKGQQGDGSSESEDDLDAWASDTEQPQAPDQRGRSPPPGQPPDARQPGSSPPPSSPPLQQAMQQLKKELSLLGPGVAESLVADISAWGVFAPDAQMVDQVQGAIKVSDCVGRAALWACDVQ